MASGQYNYPPPPPPPPTQQPGPPSGYPQYQTNGYAQQPSHSAGPPRGRGGYAPRGRGDFNSGHTQHHLGGYAPQQVNGGYGQHGSAPYIGPQATPNAPSASSYPPASWGQPANHDHIQPPQQMHHQPAAAPAPLSAQNYHPNYAPQVYQQPPPPVHGGQQQYGPQQPYQQPQPQPGYGQPPQQAQPHRSSGPNQWQPPQHHQPYDGNRGRGRGGGMQSSGRGTFNAPLMGPPIRMGFDGERQGEPMAPQQNNGYPPQYPSPAAHYSPVHAPPQAPPFSSPPNSGYPPYANQNNRGPPNRGPLDPNPFYSSSSSNHRGGRGGGGRGRGGRDHGFNDRNRNNRNDRNDRNDRNVRDHRENRDNRNNNNNDVAHKASTQSTSVTNASVDNNKNKKKKKKRKFNTLGLTPATEDHVESEEEDDADEETRLAAAFGSMEMPREPSDLEAWLAERRSKWPTKARREAWQAELARRKAHAIEQSARDKAKVKKEKEEAATKLNQAGEKETSLERQQRKAEKLRKQLERAEQKIQDALKTGTKRKRDENDSGEEDSKAEGDLVDQVIAKVTAASAESESGDSSEYTDATNSDDEPESKTSRRTGPVKVLPNPKVNLQRHCKYFSTGGNCGKKGKCRFQHDQAVRDAAMREKELNGGRPTLSQRLMQNEKEKDDLLIIRSIKYLHEKSLLDEHGSNVQSGGHSEQVDIKYEVQDGGENLQNQLDNGF